MRTPKNDGINTSEMIKRSIVLAIESIRKEMQSDNDTIKNHARAKTIKTLTEAYEDLTQ